MDRINDIFQIEKACFNIYWSENLIENQLKQEGTIDIVLYHQEKAVGFALGQIVIDECELLRIAVLEEYRGNGYGDKLMEQFIEKCMDKSVKKIFLEVRASNEGAIKLYEKYGFKFIAKRKNYYNNPSEDAKIFQKDLQNN